MSNPTAQVRPPPVAAGGCEIINVPNALAKKVGVQFKLQAATSLTQGEAALNKLASNFGDWLEQEVAGLEQARAALKDLGLTSSVATDLSTRSLDLKGLGGTYNHPLVTRIGGCLFRLLDEAPHSSIPAALIDAHVDAVRAIVRHQIRDPAHPVGQALVAELEQRVRALTTKTA